MPSSRRVALRGWALPYWNYFNQGQNKLPPTFANPGTAADPNPLFVRQRYGPNGTGQNVRVPTNKISQAALNDPVFDGAADGGSVGFGGPITTFQHASQTVPHGHLERNPHDIVHDQVGGTRNNDQLTPGLMGDPDTAALDPIFWLHHANIDRMWEQWLRAPGDQHANPNTADWLDGPNDGTFVMPLRDGSAWTYTAADVLSLTALRYSYDDLPTESTPGIPSPSAAAADGEGTAAVREEPDMASDRDVELLGSNDEAVAMVGTQARTTVRLDGQVRDKVTTSLAGTDTERGTDRVFLNLENVRGIAAGATLDVFLDVPGRSGTEEERLAGSVGLFGLRKASEPDGEHAGQGLTVVLDITDVVHELHQGSGLPDHLDVRIVAEHPIPEAAHLRIGRISVFRQGG